MRGPGKTRADRFDVFVRLRRNARGEGLSDHALVLSVLALGTFVVLLAFGEPLRHLLTGAAPTLPSR